MKNKPDLLQSTRVLTEGTIAGKDFAEVKKKRRLDVEKYLKDEDKSSNTLRDPGEGPRDVFDGVPNFSDNEIESFKDDWESYTKALQQVRKSIRDRKGYPGFDCVFMLSALDGDGVWELKVFYLIDQKCFFIKRSL